MNLLFTKTVLYAYPNLQAVMEQIDELVERKALTSINDFTPCIEQCEKILNFTAQKDVLIDLKIMVEQVLDKLNAFQSDCLEYKYFKRKPKEYFKDFDSTSRGYFRRQNALIKTLSRLFDKAGITDEWFKENCLKMDFFSELLRRVKLLEEQGNKNKSKNLKNQSAIVKYKEYSKTSFEQKQAEIA